MATKMIKAINAEGNTAYCPMTFLTEEAEKEIIKMLEDGGVTNIEVFKVGEMPLDKLPEVVQQEVRQTLKAYQRCNVYFEYGVFNTRTGYCIKAGYNFDHYVCGEYKASEVYTPEERRLNYIEVFGN